MKIVNLDAVSRQPVQMEGATDGVCKQVPVSGGDGSPLMALRVFSIPPGGHTPYHRHPYEHINYIISGSGRLVNEAGESRPRAARRCGRERRGRTRARGAGRRGAACR